MRNLIPALLIPAVCLSLHADTVGRVAGKVSGKDGKPIAGALVTIQRLDITWSKELKTSEKGTFLQVGLEPKEFKITITAAGFQTFNRTVKIPLGETLQVDATLLTPQEAANEAMKTNPAAAEAAKSMSGSAAFNLGVEAYNQQRWADALPNLERAYTDLHEAYDTMKEGDAKTTMAGQLPTIDRVYGITLYEVAKADPAKKDLLVKAEPLLAAAFEKNQKDQRLVTALVEVSKAKGDAVAEKKYQAALDAIIGPRPELAYNEAVQAFNDNKLTEAKAAVTKAISVDPKFPDSYWLLGVVEFSLGNPKAAKESFKKYMEIAPTGKKAGEVKEFLRELK